MKDELLKCPECGSTEVTVSNKQRFMANTGEHYCHSVKTHDADSEATCLDCQWIGRRDQLVHNGKVTGPCAGTGERQMKEPIAQGPVDGRVGRRVLDPCCGGHMMWFDRQHPDVVFGDRRSAKTHDADSEATCLDCQWIGRRDQLVHNV